MKWPGEQANGLPPGEPRESLPPQQKVTSAAGTGEWNDQTSASLKTEREVHEEWGEHR